MTSALLRTMNRHIYRPPVLSLYIWILFATRDTSVPVLESFVKLQKIVTCEMAVATLVLDSVTVTEDSTLAKGATFYVNGDRDLPVPAVISRERPSKVSSYLCSLANFAVTTSMIAIVIMNIKGVRLFVHMKQVPRNDAYMVIGSDAIKKVGVHVRRFLNATLWNSLLVNLPLAAENVNRRVHGYSTDGEEGDRITNRSRSPSLASTTSLVSPQPTREWTPDIGTDSFDSSWTSTPTSFGVLIRRGAAPPTPPRPAPSPPPAIAKARRAALAAALQQEEGPSSRRAANSSPSAEEEPMPGPSTARTPPRFSEEESPICTSIPIDALGFDILVNEHDYAAEASSTSHQPEKSPPGSPKPLLLVSRKNIRKTPCRGITVTYPPPTKIFCFQDDVKVKKQRNCWACRRNAHNPPSHSRRGLRPRRCWKCGAVRANQDGGDNAGDANE